ncbi:MAG: 6-phosphofructokinase, partial [Candidatus Fibromonas sp.]|nr:6-phosphofructokinase [Candidatus Fibromonas sp.]
MKIGILTSGGDCAGLNAVIRGFGKAMAGNPEAEIYGITGGYTGLINREYRQLKMGELSGILDLGGTILGTSRQPYKELLQFEENNKVAHMKENYKKMD